MDKFSARRKLLQGTLSAPLVMTVSSAGAAITTFERCYAPNPGAAPLAAFTNGTWADSWYRVAFAAKRYVQNGTGTVTVYVQYPQQPGWYKLKAPTDYTTTPDPSSLPGSNNFAITDFQLAGLVFFNPTDPNATYVGYAWLPNGSTTIANKSCYASLFA